MLYLILQLLETDFGIENVLKCKFEEVAESQAQEGKKLWDEVGAYLWIQDNGIINIY